MTGLIIKGRGVIKGLAEGEALVTRQTISPWGGIDALSGTITERRHELNGISFAGKVLVFPSAKGSSGFSTVVQVIRLAGKAPVAMVVRDMNSLTGMGCVILRVPTVTDLDQDPTLAVRTGDWVKVNGDLGTIEIQRNSEAR
jgi:hypothetical protein